MGGREKGVVSAGKPAANNFAHALDKGLKALKVVEAGEMWMDGNGITKGCLGREDLASDRCRSDPFLGGGRLMRRAGDLGRWNEKRELEHLGRVDD